MGWTVPTNPISVTARFTIGTFPVWADVDFGTNNDVPAGTKHVWLRIRNTSSTTGYTFGVRPNGSAVTWPNQTLPKYGQGLYGVKLDANRVFEAVTAVGLPLVAHIVAYSDDDTISSTDIDKSLGITGSYQTQSDASVPATAGMVYIEEVNAFAGGQSFGLRPYGETYDLYRTLASFTRCGVLVGVDASQRWEEKIGNTNVDDHLWGYLNDCTHITGSPPNKSPAITGSYETVTLSEIDDGAIAAIFQIVNTSAGVVGVDLRHPTDTSVNNSQVGISSQRWTIVAVNASKECQIEINSSAAQCYLVGWLMPLTLIGYPNVVTNAVTDIGIDAAVGHGSNDTGGGTITERGLCWGTSADPTTADDHVTAAGTTGDFSGDLTGLSIGTHYFVRAYATNSEVGTGYGDNVEFTTIALPVVETLTASDVTANSATGNGNVTSTSGGTISERGFVWSLSANPTTADDKLVVAGTTGAFSGAITGLTQATTYHYRAYAINEAGTAYGDDLIILTTAGLPVISTGTVTTGDVTNISNVSSIARGNVLSDGGSTITARGICYALTDTPTLADNVATATGTLGEFTATLTGLVKGTTYYYRAFATNAAGTAYGGIAHFVAGFESGIVTPTPATPKTIFPELPPKLRFRLDDEYPGFYYWYTAAKKFWNTVSFKGGSFTLSAGTSTIVVDSRTLATSVVVMHPTNAAAAALTPYVSAKTAGTGFTLTHGIAAGTETFDYILYV